MQRLSLMAQGAHGQVISKTLTPSEAAVNLTQEVVDGYGAWYFRNIQLAHPFLGEMSAKSVKLTATMRGIGRRDTYDTVGAFVAAGGHIEVKAINVSNNEPIPLTLDAIDLYQLRLENDTAEETSKTLIETVKSLSLQLAAVKQGLEATQKELQSAQKEILTTKQELQISSERLDKLESELLESNNARRWLLEQATQHILPLFTMSTPQSCTGCRKLTLCISSDCCPKAWFCTQECKSLNLPAHTAAHHAV
ncbi:hypothetical protein BCR33DRAFT_839067 [Rhizoclosmatium globosum]|uniref:MYND-type domain-containing protein n=1 Tax=Rhizoclosmatium globosum TaxID=329046 RepID=A0A1Y2CTA2_9FUNG|nr:hypothetical protein BCR33DRAFT_839067 [Rhizoclosmatium globosum]|eukprot:ORY50290.1 hypothetical protein BCR33DRAFT_839067 [Rhizoclosmatium globosum]